MIGRYEIFDRQDSEYTTVCEYVSIISKEHFLLLNFESVEISSHFLLLEIEIAIIYSNNKFNNIKLSELKKICVSTHQKIIVRYIDISAIINM